MATFNATGTRLVLPDGVEIAPNATDIDLSKDALENAGVKTWIKDCLLVDADAAKAVKAEAEKSEKTKK